MLPTLVTGVPAFCEFPIATSGTTLTMSAAHPAAATIAAIRLIIFTSRVVLLQSHIAPYRRRHVKRVLVGSTKLSLLCCIFIEELQLSPF
jgi:hypothetical protein